MAANQLVVGIQHQSDGSILQARGGKSGETIVQTLRGQYGELAARGQVFTASTVIAGVVIPVAAATLNSKFTLWNPAGSTKNIEIISCHISCNTATTVVGVHGLMIQRNLSGTSGVPTSVGTLAIPCPMGIVSVASVVTVAAQATLTNVAIPGVNAATTIPFWPMGAYGAVTSVDAYDLTHEFSGKLILGPDSLVAACTTVAPSTAAFIQICWAEFAV